MSFNLNVSKQVQVLLSEKQTKSLQSDWVFNDGSVHQTHCQKTFTSIFRHESKF